MKRRKKQQTLLSGKNAIGIFVILLMVLSGVGFIMDMGRGGTNSGEYNGYDFRQTEQGRWVVEIDGRQIAFSYHPSLVDYINVSSEAISRLRNTQGLHVTFDPKDQYVGDIEDIRFEMDNELWSLFGMDTYPGVIAESEDYPGFPVIDCGDGTATVPVLKFVSGDETKVEYSGNCITAVADTRDDFLRLKERIYYGLLGVI